MGTSGGFALFALLVSVLEGLTFFDFENNQNTKLSLILLDLDNF